MAGSPRIIARPTTRSPAAGRVLVTAALRDDDGNMRSGPKNARGAGRTKEWNDKGRQKWRDARLTKKAPYKPNGPSWTAAQLFLPRDRAFYLLLGIMLAVVPMRNFITVPAVSTAGLFLQRTATLILLVFSVALLSEGTFNPFIYFRF